MSLEALLNWPAPDRPLPSGQTADASSLCRTFLITDTLERSASFLLCQFVNRHLHLPNWAVRLVCISQHPSHYNAVHKKLGLHLSMYKNTYESIDLFSNLNALVQVDHNPTTNTDPVHILLNQIISTVGSDKKPCIVIDDVSMLLYAGLSIEQLVKLVMALNGYVIEKSGCLVMLVHDDNPDDEEQVSLNSLLVRLADALIHVQTLESGFTEDIHGQLTVKLGPQSLWEPPGEVAQSRVIRPGSILFRINDSSVEWFAKGTTVM
ncbi:hypothetical protein BATDEDRAFT_84977 [Batrachochytrium dendrobatidis JAM81]|uniref:Elongator complex protein 6 n=1 Tax=Batrachochytrium dendrobatidis (strain JAM81 / FGSC 10211) TaxID=684364 RepID=F4NSL5_BATDJ|nr:uncharacterized protein BATDEDRAFT_84977 [Batrachochytrium dendrobatidis JAM81]EGF83429.1 hypothetical protein BATDEDRAFT_84977 [Batrachochytrium dendrobatidis JAM81]|eukprot:XP_006676096.1 hypothetical protein BATDEDRAFT_84977 [Batrachochytrium dendrobatidis JAM81]